MQLERALLSVASLAWQEAPGSAVPFETVESWTYQVKISLIEKATGLDFGDLNEADPLAANDENVFGQAAIVILWVRNRSCFSYRGIARSDSILVENFDGYSIRH